MRAQPEMEPWIHTNERNIELRLGAALTGRAFVLRLGSVAPLVSAAPTGLKKCVETINPGLAPWAMQEYRPYRAPLRLPYLFIILMCLSWKGKHINKGLQQKIATAP